MGNKYRKPEGPLRYIFILFSAVGIGIAVYEIFHLRIFGITFVGNGYFYLLIAFFLPWVYLLCPIRKGNPEAKIPCYDLILAGLSFVTSSYFFLHAYDINYEGWEFSGPLVAKYSGLILLIAICEGARRAGGLAFAVICLVFGIMPLFANYLPGPLKGMNYSFWRTISFHSVGTESILGLPMRVVGKLLIGFLVFGVCLASLGGGQFFLNLANSLFGHRRGGAAKVSIVASAFFGSISGSVISNVITTGSFTIPAMKRTGYPAHYAGAVEACASTGGVLMPPVMGAVAFIMAQFLALPYAAVAIAAIIPSVLYYIGLFVQVDAFAAKTGLKGLPKKELPSLRQTLKEGWFYGFVFLVLLWFIFYERVEAQAPFYATAALFVLALISGVRKESKVTSKKIIEWIENTGKILIQIIPVLASIGFIIGSLMMTGVAHSFSYEIIELAGGNLGLLLIFGALTSAILGMGITISACYVILALVLCPALVKAGINPLAAHLFVLYCGLFSFITPPVAIGAYAGASLAGADPMKTGFKSMQLGFVTYIVPFFFVLNPVLLLQGSPFQIVYRSVAAIVGITLIGGSLEGYLWYVGRPSIWVRLLLIIGGGLLMSPEWRTDVFGIIVVLGTVGFLFVQALLRRRVSLLAQGTGPVQFKKGDEDGIDR
jgi:TRAP transporter 4TM/12TM fusion protein